MGFKIKKTKVPRAKFAKLIPRLVAKEDPTYTEILDMRFAHERVWAKWVSGDGKIRQCAWRFQHPEDPETFKIQGQSLV